MTDILNRARGHLRKATEFLAAAESSATNGHFNAATSAAVISGINSKDSMCLKLVGRTDKSDDHRSAVPELRRAGREAAPLAPVLDRLLSLKTKSQYQTTMVSAKEAGDAVKYAQKLLTAAERILAS
ncbi:unannotated protein [freshwater metagenome]|uniref:Unannotated protein n=1 Tax=freshwater metagenome TaxID=449393 RepID=A0A6J7FF34_9ZZZZ|nr:HEPN domain-containing protein [Actinomycetota bacterium]